MIGGGGGGVGERKGGLERLRCVDGQQPIRLHQIQQRLITGHIETLQLLQQTPGRCRRLIGQQQLRRRSKDGLEALVELVLVQREGGHGGGGCSGGGRLRRGRGRVGGEGGGGVDKGGWERGGGRHGSCAGNPVAGPRLRHRCGVHRQWITQQRWCPMSVRQREAQVITSLQMMRLRRWLR